MRERLLGYPLPAPELVYGIWLIAVVMLATLLVFLLVFQWWEGDQ